MAYCAKCGSELKDSAAFCTKCGNAVAAEISTTARHTSRHKYARRFFIATMILFGLVMLIVWLTPDDSSQKPVKAVATVAAVPPAVEPSVRAYWGTVNQYVQATADSFRKFSSLSQSVQFDDENWRAQVVICLATWQTAYQGMVELRPPAQFADLHAKMVSAMANYNIAATEIAHGFDDQDASELDAARAEILEGNREVTALTPQIQGIAETMNQ
jgi:hypothetical protein